MSGMKVRVELDRTVVLSVGVSLVAPYVFETTRQVLNRARVLCPKKTSNLANSLVMTLRARRTFVAGTVETRVKYATWVHDGTAPHKIFPKTKGALAFDWPKAGMHVVVPRGRTATRVQKSKKYGVILVIGKGYVQHPGTKARPFLMDALRQVGEKREFIVTKLGLGAPDAL